MRNNFTVEFVSPSAKIFEYGISPVGEDKKVILHSPAAMKKSITVEFVSPSAKIFEYGISPVGGDKKGYPAFACGDEKNHYSGICIAFGEDI